MTQLATSTAQTALGYPTQNKVARLFDGSYLIGYYDLAAQVVKLVQVTTPGGTPSFTTLGTTFTIASSTLTDFDLFSADGVSSTDVWITIATNTGGVGVKLSHGVYTAPGGSPTWATWDTLTTVPIPGVAAGQISSVVWNGTYLICLWRENNTNYAIRINYTTVKAGTSGWLASASTVLFGINASAGVTHAHGALLYDATVGATVAIYALASAANGTEQIFYRLLPDGNSPALANWGAQGSVFGGSLNMGGANMAVSWDHTTGTIHVAWCDSTSANTKSPGYIPSASINTTTKVITWGTAIAVGTAATANANPSLGVDGAGTVHVVFASAAAGTNSTIGHATIASPYTSASSVTTLGTASDANNLPHIPQRERFSTFLPLLYQFTKTSAYGIQYDNSFAAGAGGPHAYTSTLTAALSASAAHLRATTRSLPGTLSFVGTQAKGVTRALGGILSFTGAATTIRGKVKALSAGLSSVGAVTTRNLTRSLSGALSTSGALAKSSAHALAAALSFVGSAAHATGKMTTSALSGSGARSGALARSFAAALSVVGTRTATTTRHLTASLNATGATTRGIARTLTVGLTSAATITRTTARTLGAALASSAVTKAAKNGGAVAYTLALAGILSVSGAVNRQSTRLLSGLLTSAGALQRGARRTITATLAPVATVTRSTLRSLAAALTTSAGATFLYQAGFTAYTATLTAATAFSGSVSRSTTRTLSAALSFTGAIQRSLGRILSAVGGFAGIAALKGRLRPGRITGSVNQLNRIAGSVAFTSQIVSSVDESSRITATVVTTSRIVATVTHTSRIIGSVE